MITRNRYVLEFRRILQDPVLAAGLAVVTLFVLVAIIWPLVAMIGEAASAEGRPLFSNYLGGAVYQKIVRQTIVMGLLVATAGTLLGFLFAYVQVKVQGPFKRLMHIIALLPIISPPFAVASVIITLFGRNGRISKGVFDVRYDIFGLDGLVLAMTLAYFTIAYLNLRGMLQALDPALEEAATSLGASKFRIFRTVTLPMLIPGFAASFLLIFVEAIADLGNAFTLGGNYDVLSVRIWLAIIGLNEPINGAVLSVILLVPSLTVFLIQRYWVSRQSVVSITGKPSGVPQMITHPMVRWPLWGLVMAITLFIILIYGTIVVGAFTKAFPVNNEFTLDNFANVFKGISREALTDTPTLAIIATPIAGLIGMVMAFLVVRKQFMGRGALDFSAMLGLAVPGTVFGIGYLIVFNTPNSFTIPFIDLSITFFPDIVGGRSIMGGSVAIIMVYVVRSVPGVLRVGVAALSQIDPTIEEASISLGADNARTFRKITIPLVRPAFLAGMIYAFARSMTSVSAIIFLTTAETKILTAQIFNEVEAFRFGNAFALSVVLILIVLGAIGILYVFVGSTSGAERTIEGGG